MHCIFFLINKFMLKIGSAFLTIIKSVNNLPAYFAEQIYESMKGIGTKDKDLIRLIICRHEVNEVYDCI